MSKNKKKNSNTDTEFDKLAADIHNNLTTRLADLMSKLLNSAQDDLFDMSEAADSNEDQRRYFELMNQLRTGKTDLARAFNDNIETYLLPAKEFEATKKHEKADEDFNELSLVGQDEMEGIVLVKGIGERAAGRYREQLQHLEARLEHLALKTNIIFSQEALVPTNFCQAFNDALADDFDNINRKILFGMFDTQIANKLDALYDSINNRLIDADILPQIKLHTNKSRSSRPPPKPPVASNISSDETQQQDDTGEQASNNNGGGFTGGSNQGGTAGSGNHPSGGSSADGTQNGGGTQSGANIEGSGDNQGGSGISGFAMTAAPGGNYRHTGSQHSSAPSTAGNDAASGGGTGSGGGGGGGGGNNAAGATNSPANNQSGEQAQANTPANNLQTPENATEYQHYTAGMPASEVGRVLGNFISGSPITPESSNTSTSADGGGDFFPESTSQQFGHQEIIQALSHVQNLPQFDQPDELRFDGEAIKQAVLAEMAKSSGGAVTKRINQIAEKTIDFIELIFDAIIDDKEISDTIKTLLLRLQIPIIKASMSDQEFFIYDDHPARVLLDTIADVGIGITEHTDEMYIQLDKIISSILGEYELSAETFQNALDNLHSFVEEQEAIARKIEEQEQQQLLRKHARATVLKALRTTTTGKSLPEAVHPLILKRWPTLMFNHYLKKGKENDEWIDLVLTLRHIVNSVQPIISAEQLAKLSADKTLLLEQTKDFLNISSNSKKDVKAIVQTYRETLEEHITDANFTKEEISFAEEVINNAEPETETPLEEDTDKAAIPQNIMPGMWFHIYMGDDKSARRCKLSVIIIEDANLMFVNHKGVLVIEKSFAEFEEEVANGTTKMIMGHSAFDHAFKTVINKLH